MVSLIVRGARALGRLVQVGVGSQAVTLMPAQNGLASTGAVNARWLQAGRPTPTKDAEDAAEKIVEKGSKRMMATEEGREEMRDGTFDLDKTATRIMEEGQQALEEEEGEGSQAAAQAKEGAGKMDTAGDESEVARRVKERMISMSQTS